ncbi:two-component response regulator modulated diguanylate cyclase (plasmid) [Azospirillum sp. B510]|nr:two-component response regulator modulated diguanylate cyclase [Azospirillum sp. B510]
MRAGLLPMESSSENDILDIIDDDEQIDGPATGRVWRLLLVDDDDIVHESTKYSLRDVEILGRRLEMTHAKSAAEAQAILRRDDDFAIVLLDVVMETPDAGLKLVRIIREELKLTAVRIILRTGQPGYAPELSVIRDYDIDDYRTKSELTRIRLLTSLYTALRAYSHIHALELSRQGLERIIAASAGLFRRSSLRSFCEGTLLQLSGLLDIEASGFVLARVTSPAAATETAMRSGDGGEPVILAAAGPFRHLSGTHLSRMDDERLRGLIASALETRRSLYLEKATVLYIPGQSGDDLAIYVATGRDVGPDGRRLLEVFCSNVALGFDNVSLLDDVRSLAYYDPLTKLPNRALFHEEIGRRLASPPPPGGRLVVLLLDLDHFQAVNDGLGHETGDRLLLAVANRLCSVFSEPQAVSRIASDMFGVLAWLKPPADPRSLLQAIELCFVDPFTINGHPIDTRISAGYVLAGDGETDVDRLVRRAGMALKGAKRGGRGRILCFDSAMEAELQGRLSLVSRLAEAQASGQFSLVYQPQFSLSDGTAFGSEALLRWQLPEGTWVRPDHFIPVAEDAGHILRLGEWVLRQACLNQVRWRDGAIGRLRMAVNVSVRQLRDGTFVRTAERILSACNADPRDIELEITESQAMENDQVLAMVRTLRGMGFSIAIDDFGTGYSSLSRLQQLPASVLKIDRSFVTDLGRLPESRSIAATIVKVGHELGMTVIAEGVETTEQEEILRSLGCDAVQGFLYARPMPADRFEHWILDRASAQAVGAAS